jgi:hypothetical protein
MVAAVQTMPIVPVQEQTVPWWLRGFVLEHRSLALFRVAMGLTLVFSLVTRLPWIGIWYTDSGVMPRAALIRLRDPVVNLHMMSGTWGFQALLMAVAIVAAVCLTIGYRTRIAVIVSWVLWTSLLGRNPTISSGGEQVMRFLLFWGIFLPLDSDDERPHLSLAGVAFVLQICAIYGFAVVEKMDPIWLTERSAVYYSLHLDLFATSFGVWLRDFPAITRWLTLGTVTLELAGPLLAVSPILTSRTRTLAVVIFVGFHLGLAATMRLGIFPWICIAMWLALLPPSVWRLRVPRWGSASRSPGRWANLIVVPVTLAAALELLAPVVRPADINSVALSRQLLSLTAGVQRWAMFAPHPTPFDGWHVMTGVRGADHINLWGTTETKPALVADTYPDTRWLAYLYRLVGGHYRPYYEELAQHLCKTRQLDSLTIVFMAEVTPPPGLPVPEPKREVQWEGACP